MWSLGRREYLLFSLLFDVAVVQQGDFPFDFWSPSPGTPVETANGMLGRVVNVLGEDAVLVRFPGISKLHQVSPKQIKKRASFEEFRTTLTPRQRSCKTKRAVA